jgi:hypothetical protein
MFYWINRTDPSVSSGMGVAMGDAMQTPDGAWRSK